MTPTAGGRPAYRLVRQVPRLLDPPVLDEAQQAVVDLVRAPGHGPLLVLAGPGTGKTTTLVEAVASRVANGTDPDVTRWSGQAVSARDLADEYGFTDVDGRLPAGPLRHRTT